MWYSVPMKLYYVSWTYRDVLCYRPTTVQANSPQEAIDKACALYSDDFQEIATISVYEAPPCFVQHKGKDITPIRYKAS